MLLQTVRSYQGVKFAGSKIKGIPRLTPFEFMCNILQKKLLYQNTGTAFLSSYNAVFHNDKVCNQRTIYCNSIEIVIILYFSLQHDWGWK